MNSYLLLDGVGDVLSDGVGYWYLLLNGHRLDVLVMGLIVMIVAQVETPLLHGLAIALGLVGLLASYSPTVGQCHAHGETRKYELE